MDKQFFKNKTDLIVLLLFILGVFLIFFLSWKTNPNLKELPLIPDWLSDWTDQIRNNRRRTAVPFIGLGFVIAVYLIYNKRTDLVFWLSAWVVLAAVVCLAEAGQYFLPSRSLDIRDIIWGGLGAGIGLVFPFFAWHFVSRFKIIHFGNKTE